ncbi:unnamed protein product [Clonostachys chloroleuca]|uniref:Uncharacterized protein n=1 Tax=Clonostachys chloroleuca TaxID=1926264 RepID=A0AA35PXD0_9HYPO|nr:unnamed protein product [Clonostachys chloroleuca]
MSFSKILNPQPPAPETSGAKYNATTDPDWSGRDINKPRPLPGPIQPTESHGPMAPSSHQTLSAEHNTVLNNSGRDIYERHPLPNSPIHRDLSAKHYIAPVESDYNTTLGESGHNTNLSDSDDPTVLNDDRHEYNAQDSDEDYFSAENDTIPNNSIRNTTQARGNYYLDAPPRSLAISNGPNGPIMRQARGQTRGQTYNTMSQPTPNRGSSHIYPPESAFPIHSQSPKELSNMPGKQPTLANSGTLRIQSDSPGPSLSTKPKRRLTQQNEMNPQVQKRIKSSQDQTRTEQGPEYTSLDNELWEVDHLYVRYPDRLSQGSSVSEEELDIEVVWKATRITYNDLSPDLRKSIRNAYTLGGKERLEAFKRLMSDVKIQFGEKHREWQFDCKFSSPSKGAKGTRVTPFWVHWRSTKVRFQDLSPILKEEAMDDARRNGFIVLYGN